MPSKFSASTWSHECWKCENTIFILVSQFLVIFHSVLTHLESTMQAIFHDCYEFFVRQHSIAVLIEYGKNCVNQVLRQCQTCAYFHSSCKLIYVFSRDEKGRLRWRVGRFNMTSALITLWNGLIAESVHTHRNAKVFKIV